MSPCRACYGDTLVPCPYCDGSGLDPEDQEQECPMCGGFATVDCPSCTDDGDEDLT